MASKDVEGSADHQRVVATTEFNSSTKLFESETKTFKRRWFMLFLFVVLGAVSGVQWIQMSIVEDVLVDYYHVSGVWIEWTATVWSLTCMFFAVPGAWLVENHGLRRVIEGCAFLNLFGCVLKSFSSGRGDFPLAFFGQTISSICQAVMIGLPPRVASVWFGPEEVSTASSIGVLGFLVGCSLGFVIPPFVVQSNIDKNVTKAGIDYLNWTLTGISALIFVSVLIWFEEQPPKPPSIAALKQKGVKEEEDRPFFESLKQLARNPGYLMLLVAYGINMGVYCAFSTLLNSFILEFYPNGQKQAGGIGLSLSTSGIFGIIISGWVLDKTKKFKEVAVANFALGLVSSIGFLMFLDSGSIISLYFTAGAAGLFAAAMMSIGYEVATELTYPIAEGTSNGVVSATSQIFSVAITSIAGVILPKMGGLRCLYIFVSLLGVLILSFFQGVGTFLVCLMPKKYNRQEANASPQTNFDASGATPDHVTSSKPPVEKY